MKLQIMKKLYIAFMAAAMMTSCSDDETATQQKPLEPGSEVNFNLHLSESKPTTRTIYGDEEGTDGNKAFPIYWVDGDQVAIASPGGAVSQAAYTIAVDEGNNKQNYATSMTKIGDAGIQWGEEFPQSFYSVYPYKYTDINDEVIENTFTINDKAAIANLHIRKTQRQLFTEENRIDNGDGTFTWKGTPIGEQGIKYPDAIMYAQKQMSANGDVVLQYVPLATAFNITLAGYDYNVGSNQDDNPIVIQEIIIEAPEGVNLVGDFTATFNEDATTAPVVGGITNASNIIHVPCLTNETNYLHPNPSTDKISLNVFAIPTDGQVTEKWKLHVKTNYKTYTRTLKPTSEAQGVIKPGQVHKLNMPKINITSDNTLDAATWMKNIPRNVYITDLSLPGAWYCQQEEYQGLNPETNAKWTIQGLWEKGVRAFSVETRSGRDLAVTPYTPNQVFISGTGNNYTGLIKDNYVYWGGTNISTVMADLCDAVSSKKYGYAVLMLSYADGGEVGHRAKDYAFWLQGIYEAYNRLNPTRKAAVYTDPVTPETTIGDVAGKLIIQVNVASGLPGGSITLGSYGQNLPGLLTYVNRKREAGTAPISLMHWMKWSNDYMTNTNVMVNDHDNEQEARNALKSLEDTYGTDAFFCNYSIANRTQVDTGTNKDIPTYYNRKKALSRILRNGYLSLDMGYHNLWSIFAAGGTQTTSATDENTNAKAFAVNMNSWILGLLNERINLGDYGPFGVVLCDYIAREATYNDTTVKGTDIIDRILRMNQLFRLSRDENKPEWPDNGSGTSTPSAASYSSTLSKDANGWNAY